MFFLAGAWKATQDLEVTEPFEITWISCWKLGSMVRTRGLLLLLLLLLIISFHLLVYGVHFGVEPTY